MVLLMSAVLAALLAAGCGEGGDTAPRRAAIPEQADPWPLGDGSSWHNVMEAGFNPPAMPRSAEVLAACPSAHIHFDDELSGGAPCVSLVGFGLPCRLSAVRAAEGRPGGSGKAVVMATGVFPVGGNRLLQIGLKSGGKSHIALSDRFWSVKRRNGSPGAFDSGRTSRVGSPFLKGGGGRQGVSPRADVPNRFWIFF